MIQRFGLARKAWTTSKATRSLEILTGTTSGVPRPPISQSSPAPRTRGTLTPSTMMTPYQRATTMYVGTPRPLPQEVYINSCMFMLLTCGRSLELLHTCTLAHCDRVCNYQPFARVPCNWDSIIILPFQSGLIELFVDSETNMVILTVPCVRSRPYSMWCTLGFGLFTELAILCAIVYVLSNRLHV